MSLVSKLGEVARDAPDEPPIVDQDDDAFFMDMIHKNDVAAAEVAAAVAVEAEKLAQEAQIEEEEEEHEEGEEEEGTVSSLANGKGADRVQAPKDAPSTERRSGRSNAGKSSMMEAFYLKDDDEYQEEKERSTKKEQPKKKAVKKKTHLPELKPQITISRARLEHAAHLLLLRNDDFEESHFGKTVLRSAAGLTHSIMAKAPSYAGFGHLGTPRTRGEQYDDAENLLTAYYFSTLLTADCPADSGKMIVLASDGGVRTLVSWIQNMCDQQRLTLTGTARYSHLYNVLTLCYFEYNFSTSTFTFIYTPRCHPQAVLYASGGCRSPVPC